MTTKRIEHEGRLVYYERKARSTGTIAVLEDTERPDAEFSVEGFKFAAACREHDTVVGIEGKGWSQAYATGGDPRKWCAACQTMPAPQAKPTPVRRSDEEVAADRLAAAQKGREAAQRNREREEAEAAREAAREAREELRGLPQRIRQAERDLERARKLAVKALVKVDRARPGTDAHDARVAEWRKAERAYIQADATLLSLVSHMRRLERSRDAAAA